MHLARTFHPTFPTGTSPGATLIDPARRSNLSGDKVKSLSYRAASLRDRRDSDLIDSDRKRACAHRRLFAWNLAKTVSAKLGAVRPKMPASLRYPARCAPVDPAILIRKIQTSEIVESNWTLEGNGAPEGRGTPKSNSSGTLCFNGLGAEGFRDVDL